MLWSLVGAVAPIVVAAAALGLGTLSTQPSSPVAPSAPAPPDSPKFTIADVAFLAGSWQGDMGGSFVEEMWSRPQGNNVVGTFRWLKKDGTPAMLEMLAITQESDAVRLRLRHYSAMLHAKEDADKPITLRLSRTGEGLAQFDAEKDSGDLVRVTYTVADGRLAVSVEFAAASEPGASPRPPLKFNLARAKP